MNIEQYRALKAQEETQEDSTIVEQPVTETKPVEEVIETKPVEEVEVVTVEINGEQLTLDELRNGYLRQSDYTKKTQDLSKQRNETQEAIAFYEYLKNNPQIAQQIKTNGGVVPERIDPSLSKVKELEDKMYDMMLDREIETLQGKYKDFDVREVLNTASEKGITNLEDAYHLSKSKKPTNNNVDVDTLKEQIRKELLQEIQQEKDSTQTIISTNTEVIKTNPNLPTITEAEIKIAKHMKMKPEDYIKWRDVDKKK